MLALADNVFTHYIPERRPKLKAGSRVIVILMVIAVIAMVAITILYDLPDNTLIWKRSKVNRILLEVT